ncbi:MlaD family protein [Rhodovulum steppense]|nr:MlaD family protein [Rhodovulum steppense]
METRANYVLIGAFTLLGFVGLLAFFLWFARVELNRQFAYYDVEFPTVSGLSDASEVRFSGLPVGKVVDVRLSPERTGRIRVRIEVSAETPVRTSSVATIESQGVTGVSYVGLSSGDPADPLLDDVAGDGVPFIESGRSVLQTLSEDAPAIVEEALVAARQLTGLLGPENQGRISSILENLDRSSADLGQALDSFSKVTDTVASSTEQIAAFATRLEDISAAATTALETADGTLREVTELARRAGTTLDAGDAALDSGRATLDSANLFIREQLPPVLEDVTLTTAALREEIAALGTDARAMMTEFRMTGTLANTRLTEARQTLQATDDMLAVMTDSLASLDRAADQLDSFIATDATPLVADARALIANADRVVASAATLAENELPTILEDIRTAAATAARTVETVGADLSTAAGRADAISADASSALASVTDTFTRANATLDRLNTTLETGDQALAAADRAFASADRVLREEIGQMTASLRDTLARLDTAIDQVSADVPVIAGQIRETAERANSAFGEIERTATSLGPPLRSFAGEGLPQYARLARETRDLVDRLDRLIRQIDRNPARFLLGGEDPVYRR